LEAEAAKRRLAQLFQSEQLGRANHRSTAALILGHTSHPNILARGSHLLDQGDCRTMAYRIAN
jgi:hypothetical protein